MLKELIFTHQKNRNNQMKDLSKLSGNDDCDTLDYDPTDGYHLRGCPVCEEEVKYTQTEDYYEYHPKVDRLDDDFSSGLENERQSI